MRDINVAQPRLGRLSGTRSLLDRSGRAGEHPTLGSPPISLPKVSLKPLATHHPPRVRVPFPSAAIALAMLAVIRGPMPPLPGR